jgi:hypothetical protein
MKTLLRLDVTHHGLYPDVVELLRSLPPGSLFHTKYRFRHPAAIYQLSLRQLAVDFKRVLAAYSSIRSGAKPLTELGEDIAQSQRILIYSLREHLDDCQMILMCFVDPSTVATKAKSPDEILKSAGFVEQQTFWNGVHNYIDSYLMPLVNALKHSQGRSRTLMFECSPVDIRLGFYLEEMDEHGTAQPSIKLHQGNSAFSYARDIRANLAFVFRAADSLHSAVNAVLKRLSVSPLPAPDGGAVGPGIWSEMCREVAALDNGVFPQEVNARFVRFSLSAAGSLLIRELDRDVKLSFPTTNTRCQTQTLGDGMTKSFRMPYLGENRPRIK